MWAPSRRPFSQTVARLLTDSKRRIHCERRARGCAGARSPCGTTRRRRGSCAAELSLALAAFGTVVGAPAAAARLALIAPPQAAVGGVGAPVPGAAEQVAARGPVAVDGCPPSACRRRCGRRPASQRRRAAAIMAGPAAGSGRRAAVTVCADLEEQQQDAAQGRGRRVAPNRSTGNGPDLRAPYPRRWSRAIRLQSPRRR